MNGLLQVVVLLGILALTFGGSIKKAGATEKREASLKELMLELEEALENDIIERVNVAKAKDGAKRERSAHKHLTAAEAMRAAKRPAKRTRKLMEKQEQKRQQRIKDIAARALNDNNREAFRRLVELEIGKRADEDPNCEVAIDCTDTTNRMFDSDDSSVEYRTTSGSCNNLDNYSFGMAEVQHLRWLDDAYQNSKWSERSRSVTSTRNNVVSLPSARSISNGVHSYEGTTPTNTESVSVAFFQWGQFLDHDIISTPEGTVPDAIDCCDEDVNHPFCMPITIEADDPYFAEGYCMPAQRSFTVLKCDDSSGFQNQINEITAFVDASQVYGSSDDETMDLRTFYGGFMKTVNRDFPPAVNDSDDISCDDEWPGYCLKAGDTRANVFPGLSALHTVFLREHNRIAKELGGLNSDWSDEKIFQQARKIVAAEIQHITYDEFLPVVMTSDKLSEYEVSTNYSYNSDLDASIYSGFSIAFRFGHSLLPAEFKLSTVDSADNVTNATTWDSEDVYLLPSVLFEDNYAGIDEVATFLGYSNCPHADRYMEDAARNKLFEDSVGDSFDLAALNIQRGREWGTPAYTEYRNTVCGIGAVSSWDDLIGTTHDSDTVDVLKSVYADPQDVDLFTGIVTETPNTGSLAGPTLSCILGKQFSNLKHGDRFWYETSDSTVGFTTDQLTEIKKVTLAKVLCENLDINRLPEEVFKTSSSKMTCTEILDSAMDLTLWQA